MIEMTIRELRNNNLLGAVERLKREFVDLKTATKILGISRALRDEMSKAQELFDVILKKHYSPHEDPEQKKKGVFMPKDGKAEECVKIMNEFEGTKIQFKFPKLKMEELGDIKITANELEGLKPLLDEPL